MKTERQINIEKAADIVRSNGIDATFSGYSDTNGISVYFLTSEGVKVRVSDHSVTNIDRIFNEVHLKFPVKMLSLNKKVEVKNKFVLTPEMIEEARLRKISFTK